MLCIYLVRWLRQSEYDQFDSFVTLAPDAIEAKHTHPRARSGWHWDAEAGFFKSDPEDVETDNYTWTNNLEEVEVAFLGTALSGSQPGVVLASFNAG